MLETLARNWWVVAIRGTAALIFGLLALIWPAITVLVLVALFGAYALVDGAFALGTAIFGRGAARGSRGWLVVEGIAGIVVGILTFVWPGITATVLGAPANVNVEVSVPPALAGGSTNQATYVLLATGPTPLKMNRCTRAPV